MLSLQKKLLGVGTYARKIKLVTTYVANNINAHNLLFIINVRR